MEISVYSSLDVRVKNKSLYRFRVDCVDCFPYDKFFEVSKFLFGSDVIIEILKV